MIDEVKLREKYNLSIKEYEAICERTDELVAFEEKSGFVISRCNGTLARIVCTLAVLISLNARFMPKTA